MNLTLVAGPCQLFMTFEVQVKPKHIFSTEKKKQKISLTPLGVLSPDQLDTIPQPLKIGSPDSGGYV